MNSNIKYPAWLLFAYLRVKLRKEEKKRGGAPDNLTREDATISFIAE
jgi:hypothetical protein